MKTFPVRNESNKNVSTNEKPLTDYVFEQTAMENMAKEITVNRRKTFRILALLFGTIIFFCVLIFTPKHEAALTEKLIMIAATTVLSFGWLSMIYPHNNESQK